MPRYWLTRKIVNVFSRFSTGFGQNTETGPGFNSQMKPMPSEPRGSVPPPPTVSLSQSAQKSSGLTTTSIFRNWLRNAVGTQSRSIPNLLLDETPTGEEEQNAFLDQREAMGLPYKEGEAKQRIDTLARWLAAVWTVFLMYIVIAQGNKDGTIIHIDGNSIQILPHFALAKEEFIAVFTTTTASVFGFLVIVANHLFKNDKSK